VGSLTLRVAAQARNYTGRFAAVIGRAPGWFGERAIHKEPAHWRSEFSASSTPSPMSPHHRAGFRGVRLLRRFLEHSCPNLEFLEITNGASQSAETARALMESCPNLTKMTIRGPASMAAEGASPLMDGLSASFRHLKYLWLDGLCNSDRDIAPLLYGTRFNDSLETLRLESDTVIAGVESVSSFPSSKSPMNLELNSVTLRGRAMSDLLRHFTGLKTLEVTSCGGVAAGIPASLGAMDGLERVRFRIDDKRESDQFREVLPAIVSRGPSKQSVMINSDVTHRLIADIAGS